MTASTRSRLMLCLVVGLIAMPAEALLLPVARTPNPIKAAVAWTASLDQIELRKAASNIDAYPPVYRKAIMGALTPDDRSSAWREFFQDYLDSHPSLSAEQVAVVREAMNVATPVALGSSIPAETKQRISDVFTRAQTVLGANAAKELFVTLGPKQSAEGKRAAAHAAIGGQHAVMARSGRRGGCRMQLQRGDRHLRCSAESVAQLLGAVHVRVRSELADVRPALVVGVHGLVQGHPLAVGIQ